MKVWFRWSSFFKWSLSGSSPSFSRGSTVYPFWYPSPQSPSLGMQCRNWTTPCGTRMEYLLRFSRHQLRFCFSHKALGPGHVFQVRKKYGQKCSSILMYMIKECNFISVSRTCWLQFCCNMPQGPLFSAHRGMLLLRSFISSSNQGGTPKNGSIISTFNWSALHPTWTNYSTWICSKTVQPTKCAEKPFGTPKNDARLNDFLVLDR